MFKRKKMIYVTGSIIAGLVVLMAGYMNQPKFDRQVRGERLKRVEQSPNYRDGKFQNRENTPQLTSDKSRARTMFDFLFEKRKRNRPKIPIVAVKTDLKVLDRHEDLLVWFGHSSYLIQCTGRRMLVDPVFNDASPISFINKPFGGTDVYTDEDMPDIDYLIITHDHWDHLDYATVRALRSRVQKVVCPLGVGEHFEYRGYALDQIIEMDWDEQYRVDSSFVIHCLPARHFSGRTLHSNQTLWASYILPDQTIYLSGDSGYGIHYQQIAKQFPHIDLAIMENGQYNPDWRYIHLLPDDLKKAISELQPQKVVPVHNSKYALAKHPWDEPLEESTSIPSVVLPKIGEVVDLKDPVEAVGRWWRNMSLSH